MKLKTRGRKNIVFGPPYAVLNLSKIGVRYFRLCIKCSSVSRKKLVKEFLKHPNIGWIFSAKGWFNLAIGIWAKDNAEINDLSASIRSSLHKNDEIVYQSELTSLYGFGNRPVTHESLAMPIVDATLNPLELSPLELDYIKILTIDSSLSKTELSQILGISQEELESLHKHLVENGIIVGYQKRINYAGTYYKVFVDTLSKKEKDDVMELEKILWDDNACIYFERANGKYDLEFELILPIRSALKKYLKGFSEYKVAELTENLYTNLYPLSKVAHLKEIKDAVFKQEGDVIDLRNSKLWYLPYKGSDTYLNIYENKKYFELMEKNELDLFNYIALYLRNKYPKTLFHIIDIGSGDGLKGRILIEKIGESSVKAYYPIDIQPLELAAALMTNRGGKYSKHPTLLNFENLLTRFPLSMLPHEMQIYCFLGGTYGNFKIENINSYLKPLLVDPTAVLLITMPILSVDKTERTIIDSYTNLQIEDVAFGPLAQIGFKKNDFVLNLKHPELVVQLRIENKCVVLSFILKHSITIFGRTFKRGTAFEMISSWKPTLEEFTAALERDFKIEKMFRNPKMAIAVLSP